ncbi:thiamine biosynthesis protein ThiS [Photobacterium sanctipauli]|uniref:Thiamine biosynthesis protein ThiS n=1 Tax=Photobacterium sanctipauli TaxID=1342794 RepID=A0A2T3NT05_9GAMM|nr:sulfur carrier protein ThiS [Photobacterium sanctipauli]PSW19388.1 thiamine biosynthesis protein ThiS [Photobacterium sanctipauli]
MTTTTIIQLLVNDKSVGVAEGATLVDLLNQLDMPLPATAVALNDDIVARTEWETTVLNTGDRIALFQAIAGG